jgi:hypothetical protein
MDKEINKKILNIMQIITNKSLEKLILI